MYTQYSIHTVPEQAMVSIQRTLKKFISSSYHHFILSMKYITSKRRRALIFQGHRYVIN